MEDFSKIHKHIAQACDVCGPGHKLCQMVLNGRYLKQDQPQDAHKDLLIFSLTYKILRALNERRIAVTVAPRTVLFGPPKVISPLGWDEKQAKKHCNVIDYDCDLTELRAEQVVQDIVMSGERLLTIWAFSIHDNNICWHIPKKFNI